MGDLIRLKVKEILRLSVKTWLFILICLILLFILVAGYLSHGVMFLLDFLSATTMGFGLKSLYMGRGV